MSGEATARVTKSGRQTADELLGNADVLLGELSTRPGAHEVCASREVELRAVYENDDFAVSASSASSLYGARTIVDGKLGFATTNSDRPEALKAAAREALDVAKLSIPSEHHGIVSGEGAAEHLDTCDPALLAYGPEDVYTCLGRVVEEARRDDRVLLDRIELSWKVSTDAILNSNGRRGSYAQSGCSWFVMGMAKAGEEVTSFDYDGSQATSGDAIESEIVRSVGAFRTSVLGSLDPQRGETYRGPVLLHPYAVLDLLGGIVQANCNGLAHVDDVSPWKGREGELVASDFLSFTEDPLDVSLAEWAPFDREGRATSRHALIDHGHLAFVGHNCFTAHRAGAEPTGNAVGDPDTLPQVGFHNMSIEADGGDARVVPDEELLRRLGQGLVVKRFSGNSDPLSGLVSGTAKNSWWVRGGERAHAVSEVMISGNLFEMLGQVLAAGDTPHSYFGSARAPYLLVDGVSVTAG